MIKFKDLKQFCEKNGIKSELSPIYSKGEFYNPETRQYEHLIYSWEFGMNNIACRSGKSEWQWVWFKSLAEEVTDDTYFYFEHRYSMLNGKCYKGWRESSRVFNSIVSRV